MKNKLKGKENRKKIYNNFDETSIYFPNMNM